MFQDDQRCEVVGPLLRRDHLVRDVVYTSFTCQRPLLVLGISKVLITKHYDVICLFNYSYIVIIKEFNIPFYDTRE